MSVIDGKISATGSEFINDGVDSYFEFIFDEFSCFAKSVIFHQYFTVHYFM